MPTSNKLQPPLVHLNGTGKAGLIRQYETARNRLHDAIGALIEMAPHGRDYYPLPAGAFEKAREQHRARIRKLTEVYDEIGELWHKVLKGETE